MNDNNPDQEVNMNDSRTWHIVPQPAHVLMQEKGWTMVEPIIAVSFDDDDTMWVGVDGVPSDEERYVERYLWAEDHPFEEVPPWSHFHLGGYCTPECPGQP